MTTDENTSTNSKQGTSPLTVFIIAILIGGAFLIGKLYSEVTLLRQGTAVTAKSDTTTAGIAQGNTDQAAAQPQVPQEKFPAVDMGSVDPVTKEDHIRGSLDAKVFLVEYSDNECPYCKTFHATMQQIKDEYKDDVAWVYRQFPLEQLHPKAPAEAEATECVAQIAGNDAFWKYLDEVVETSNDTADLVKVATSQGLNGSKVEKCLTDGDQTKNVQADLTSGQKAGINGTPGTLLIANGTAKLIPGAYPYSDVKKLIDEALAQ